MKENESIDSFVTRLTGIINKAASVGLAYEDSTLVRKLLNAVPDRFLQIVASIEQYSDLDTMSLDEAIGRLKTFEERIKYKNERTVNTQERLLFTRHEDQGQQFRRRDRVRCYASNANEVMGILKICRSRIRRTTNFIDDRLEPTYFLLAAIEEKHQNASLTKKNHDHE
ncbi:hypothetical protein Tco_0657773 [Tanacetum coccineum]